ncbi:EF-hand calcium-binding domain-containing protein 4B [Bagarius yarrelli]|uniref:EF-hand calcium-binding domain-containing protein 4B n=1 Tax=Bagarius yarrelli TaxID=175774 RepID=A0A556THH3_BAGYA|nr:EF-hand calcium-binding domain-containing protein 4B [Bagarius yarrelli]
MMENLEGSGSGLVAASQLRKIDEFFQICDSEGKGYITPTDMRRLNKEIPLSAEELENVFDSLDLDRNGCLTLEEFSSGFSKFLNGRSMSQLEDQLTCDSQDPPEALYQNEPHDYEEEGYFSMLMESLGASNIFEDPSEVRTLWIQLRKDEPHLLYNFEEFLARVISQIRVAQQEKNEMECAFKKKAATHNGEIQQLYEEMEQQIKKEKSRLSHKDLRSQDLQQQLISKEQELECLFLKQRGLEQQCQELHTQHQKSQLENINLKTTNQELSRELEYTCHELSLTQEHLEKLQEQALRQQQEKDIELYKITERLQKEKENLVHQLDLLREMNKHLKDEKDSVQSSNIVKNDTLENGPTANTLVHSDRKRCKERIISIEEDHLPQLIEAETCSLFNQMNDKKEGGQIDLQMSPVFSSHMFQDSLTRGQPVGMEALQQVSVDSSVSTPQRLFKIILVGDSSVGKTALLHRFCDGHFHRDTSATVGIDFSVRNVKLGDSHVALQLWDTAGQERFQSITKQFFRKADGIVVTYDITLRDSFKSVRSWLVSIQEAVGGPVPIMILGNKSDRESMRQVATEEGEKLAMEAQLLFYECSAYSGYNVLEAMVHLARVLKEQEDRVWKNTVNLVNRSGKKKSCCT